MNKILLFFLLVFFSFLIDLITSPLRGWDLLRENNLPVGLHLCAVVAFAIYFIIVNLMLAKYASKLKPHWILFACLLGCCIIQLPMRIFYFNSTLISLPDFLFHLFGIFMGYLFYISCKYVKSGIVVISLLCCIFLYFKGYGLWLHKLNFGTFTGIQHVEAKIPEFQFTDKDGNTITNKNFIGKYTILDFWTTSCGICFREFPKFEELYRKYQSNSDVAIYAANIKLPRDKAGAAFEIISEEGYSFPVLQGGPVEDAKNMFGITVYPTVIVLDPTGMMVFRGDMEKAFSFVDRELKME